MFERETTDGILTIRLAHKKANALDLELCDAVRGAIEDAAADDAVCAIVLTGTGSIFSAGVDLPRMLDGGADYVQPFVESLDAVLRALFLFPKPAIAAVNGHAIAGGAILAFACDYRLMIGGRIGVPELLVGVPFPPLALEIVRFAIPRQHIQSMLYLGRTIEVAEAHAMRIVDEVVSGEALSARAQSMAAQIAAVAPEAFRITKRQLREPFLRDAARVAAASADEIDAIWAAPATHERIRAYLAKTIGKK
ncbi:MAG: enoyl-CoA hydratase/isomerase family protein [Thermoanaerobaculia bacterium]